MRKPRTIILVCGNPIVATAGLLTTGWMVFMAVTTGTGWGVGILALVIGGFFQSAYRQARDYEVRKREWDSYDFPEHRQ